MKNKLSLFAVPYVGWMSIFVVAPIIIMVVYAFSTAAGDFTLENFARMGTYTAVFTRSFKLAIIATLIALLIGYPVSYMLSKEGPQVQRIAMVLIMLPMWMNFLLRTYSWMSILENNGLLNQLFQQIGLIDLYNQIAMHFASDPAAYVPIDHFQMIGTQGAVVLGMVYNYLPFMILPIYSVLVKLDHSLIEAARDLGASSVQVFRKVILPLSLPGVLSGITMVFVPSVSTFAISRLLGGGTQMMLGDLIEQQFLGGDFTLENFARMGTYTAVFTRSFKLAIIATLIALLIGYPVSYMLSKEGPQVQRIAMVLIMLPMWMNFLLRTYSWMSILENNGLLNQLFQQIGLIDLYNQIAMHFASDPAAYVPIDHFQMIGTQGAVVLGMVYNYLPFMILPIYSVLVKLDHSLIEAARDLGASSVQVFRKVILPLSLPGVLSGITMVFVPSVSTFAISRLLGGGTQMMLGDLIEQQFLGGAYNPQLGAAIALVMMAIVVVCMLVMNRFGDGEEQAVML